MTKSELWIASAFAASLFAAQAFDVNLTPTSNIANPQRIASTDFQEIANRITTIGTNAYISAYGGWSVVSLATPFLANVGGFNRVDSSTPFGPSPIIAARRDFAFVATVTVSGWPDSEVIGSALTVYDVVHPAHPELVGGIQTQGYLRALSISGNYAYLASSPSWWGSRQGDDAAFQIINISEPTRPIEVANFPLKYAWALAVSDKYALVLGDYSPMGTNSDVGLTIIDTSSVTNPRQIGSVQSDASDVAIVGNYAYLLGNDLRVLDMSSPSNPLTIGAYSFSGNAMAISGDYLYIASDTGIQVIDIGDPRNLHLVGANQNAPGRAIAVGNDTVLVLNGPLLTALYKYQPAVFTKIAQTDGATKLRLTGPPDVPGRVQRSSDMRNWTDWLPISFGGAPLDLIDSNTSSLARFYRIVVP